MIRREVLVVVRDFVVVPMTAVAFEMLLLDEALNPLHDRVFVSAGGAAQRRGFARFRKSLTTGGAAERCQEFCGESQRRKSRMKTLPGRLFNPPSEFDVQTIF